MDELEGHGHERLFAVGQPGEHDATRETDEAGAVKNRHSPKHGNHLESLHLPIVSRRHVAGDDMGHAGITEADAELTDDESPQGGSEAPASGVEKVGVDRPETLDQSTETAESGDGVQRQGDESDRNQQALEEVGPGHCPKTAEGGDENDHRRADHYPEDVAASPFETEGRRKRLSGSCHLRCDIAHHADQDDRRGGDPQHVAWIPPTAGDDVGEGDRSLVCGERPKAGRDQVDVDQISEETTRGVPETGNAEGEGHADGAEGDPSGLRARGGGDAGGPRTQRSTREVEVLATVGPLCRPPADEEKHSEIRDHDDGDGGEGGAFDRRHRSDPGLNRSRRSSTITPTTSTSGKTHSNRCAPSVSEYSSIAASLCAECTAATRPPEGFTAIRLYGYRGRPPTQFARR